MQVQVEKLRQALRLLEPVVPSKPTLPILKYVWLGEGKAVATDLEAAITISGLGAPTDVPLCLPYDTLVKLLASVPGHLVATITPDSKRATITAGQTEASLATMPSLDYPPIPNPTPTHVAAVDGDALVRALATVLPYAAGKDDKRPVLETVCLTPGETPEAATADGFRLAWEPLLVKLPGEKNLLIPTGAVRALANLWRHAPKPPELEGVATPAQIATAKRLVRLEYTADVLRVSFGEVSLLTKLVQGTFPDYRQLIPQGGMEVEFDASDLLRACKGMVRVAKEGSGIFRLSWGNGYLKVEARAEDVGTLSATIPAACGGEGRIAFNAGYLMEYLKGKEGMVSFAWTSSQAPCRFSYRGVSNLALMPMFVKDDAPAPTPPAPTPVPVEESEPDLPSEENSTPDPQEAPTPEASTPTKPARRRKKKS